ncbi:MAG: flagellar export chaperone FlgN [Nitrospirae bacterium]|nr:flagellar export chaperone FlgN [Nitrospirota bacterium]
MSNYASAAVSILDILTREEAHCDLLCQTLQQERSALRRLSVTEFPSLNEQRLQNLQQFQSLESERVAVVNRFAEAWGLPRETVTLQVVISRLDQPDKRNVERCHERLTAKVRALREDTAVNAVLMAGIQTLCRKAMHLSMEALPEQGIYSASGESQRVGLGGAMLRQRG